MQLVVLKTLLSSQRVCSCRYLQEIGYTDTIIDVRSARVRQMLGLPCRDAVAEPKTSVTSDQAPGKRMIEAQGNG